MRPFYQAVFGSLLLFIAACSTSVNMYPIDGPLAQQKPLPLLIANADGITGNTGKFSFTNAKGAICTGRWSSVAPMMVTTSSGTLLSQYGSIAGFSTSVSNVPGVNKGQAFAICSDNITFDVEFYTGSGTASGFGLAKDSKGNVYKLIF